MAKVYLGTGVKYPYEVDKFGKIAYESGTNLVKQSIETLLNTPVGTELGRESFGSEIRIALFEPNDRILYSLLDYFIIDAVQKWEKRVNIIDIVYTTPAEEPERLDVEIYFREKQSNQIDSFIFPFYRELKN